MVDHILKKPGALDAEEYRTIQEHVRIGGRVIALAMQRVRGIQIAAVTVTGGPLAFLEVARQIAPWHHERWDGIGCPDGLRGNDIPLPARIMAVRDVFDALITTRIYKRACGVEEAFRIVAEERGKQFDPDISNAFVKAKDDIASIARELAG